MCPIFVQTAPDRILVQNDWFVLVAKKCTFQLALPSILSESAVKAGCGKPISIRSSGNLSKEIKKTKLQPKPLPRAELSAAC